MIQRTITEIPTQRSVVEVFRGINRNIRTSEGDLSDMHNMSSSHYPVLSPRGRRGIKAMPTEAAHTINGMISKDALCYVDGTKLYINDYEVPGVTLENSQKQLVSMGAYIVIFPDMYYINTQDYSDKGFMYASFYTTGSIRYEMCNLDGSSVVATISSTAPANPVNMQMWIDTSGTTHVLKQYSASSSMWVSVATTYVKISAYDIAARFKQYDGVYLTGIKPEQLSDLNDKTSILYDVHHDAEHPANDYVIVVGFLDTAQTQSSGDFEMNRSVPKMDFVIESGNRLWGCRYGADLDGHIVNEIYACKLGDFTNWNCYMGLSTDSYTASCGTDGQWTGAISYLGYPLFFKEGFMHKVFGSQPSNFQIQSTPLRGVAKGAGKSLAIVNETLFYKSKNGVCAYTGSLPTEITSAFADLRFSGCDQTESNKLLCGAKAGSYRNKYYINMMSEQDGKWYLCVYDAAYGMWHIEDNVRIDDFCESGGELYMVEHESQSILSVGGTGNAEAEAVEWMAESGTLGTGLADHKYISRLLVRMMGMEDGCEVKFEIMYDSSGVWKDVWKGNIKTLDSVAYPIRPRRCDHFKIRISGKGDVRILSIVKTIEQGSDER